MMVVSFLEMFFSHINHSEILVVTHSVPGKVATEKNVPKVT
jgi:hypothetical protein